MADKLKKSEDKKNNKSGVEKLPEETRKMILWLSLVVIAAIIISFWLILLPRSLKIPPKDEQRTKELEEIGTDFSNFLKVGQEGFKTLNEEVKKMTIPTSTSQPTPEEINKIKERLENKEINNLNSSL